MIELKKGGVFLNNGTELATRSELPVEEARKRTMAYRILQAHNQNTDPKKLKIKFDAMASHDITYVGIIQTARASGLKEFPIPYVLTNCHNSLCAVGGTINEDDHVFGLSAAKKYGGIYVPAHQAVIHAYMREQMSGCGKMILGSDSHTRYGALGTMAIGEGGPELVKQLLCRTYDIDLPEVICIYLTGTPQPGVGPQDVALAIIGAVFANGFVKNRIMEFVGDGIAHLPMEFRNGIDVMTTETTCLSSIWITDDETKNYYKIHGREQDFQYLQPQEHAFYDGAIVVDLSKIGSMIALPMHPSNVYPIKEVLANARDILPKYGLADKILPDGRIAVDQGEIAGCAGGTFDNICAAADILRGHSIGSGEFALAVYPASQPTYLALLQNQAASDLMRAGVTLRSAFCGPCFGAGDVPANGGFSIRHSTRNFPNREGSKPANGQYASVGLLDARSIAATARNHGILTAATDLEVEYRKYPYQFDDTVYKNRVYNGFGQADLNTELKYGPNITDWPTMQPLSESLLLCVCSVITDPVTTTDELIPSGETSSYRSNPKKLAEFTLSRRDPSYVSRAKAVQALEHQRLQGTLPADFSKIYSLAKKYCNTDPLHIGIGSVIFAVKPGDGSAREQAASCQKVLGGWANLANEYATKRYRSNLINWGMLPLLTDANATALPFTNGDVILLPGIRSAIIENVSSFPAYILRTDQSVVPITLRIGELTEDERKIILDGCLINYYTEK